MRERLSFAVVLVMSVANCGGVTEKSPVLQATSADGGLGVYAQPGCTQDSDCATTDLCAPQKCDEQSGQCYSSPVTCSLAAGTDPACNVAACDEYNGNCASKTSNEGVSCTADNGQPGACVSGACTELPTCYAPVNGIANRAACGGPVIVDANTMGAANTTQATTNYACAPGESGPEIAYVFSVTVDEDVNLSLTSAVDLDLIVLQGSCTEAATCVNPALAIGGFAGVTAGTGNEHITFHALAGTAYYIVVDGKSSGNYQLSVDSCGACSASAATTLACNSSTPMLGDTSLGQSAIDSYTCAGTTVAAPGKEQTFLFVDTAPSPRLVTASLSGADTAVSIMALPVGTSTMNAGACDPTQCLAEADSTSGAATMTWQTAGTSALANTFTEYYVAVDTSLANATTTFGLELDCPAYCAFSGFPSLTCSMTNVGQGVRNDQEGSTDVNTQYGPANAPCGGLTNLAGPEYVYLMATPAVTPKQYAITLSTLTAGKTLALVVLDAGTTKPTTCSPALACAKAASGATYKATGNDYATVKVTPTTSGVHYYLVVVDGVTATDAADFTLEIASGCN